MEVVGGIKVYHMIAEELDHEFAPDSMHYVGATTVWHGWGRRPQWGECSPS